MKGLFLPLWCGWMLTACLFSGTAAANVVIATTRVIYPAEQTEVTVSLSNKGQHPSLVQVWIDDDRPDVPVEALNVPFSMTPALFRLDPDKGQTLRLFQHEHDFPSDRESLFWLNVLDIPPAGANGNALQLSVRSRIKLFYRPRDLPGSAQQAVSALTWNMVKRADAWVLEAHNPSRYYINLSELSVHLSGRAYEVSSAHIAPLSTRRFDLPGLSRVQKPKAFVHFASVNDYGAVVPAQQPVNVMRSE